VSFTEDQILTLAPDEASKKSGRDLANLSKWVSMGADDKAVWGECKGSGSKPYQTQIDYNQIGFKCSCPSRKFPCKHGIGLALLFARQQDVFTSKKAPAWVVEWIQKRAVQEEKKSEKKEVIVDEAAQAKRQQAREQKVNAGVEELQLWIRDIVRNGIIHMPEKGYLFWEGMAKRMVDAQAPGLAAMVKTLGQTPFYKEGWQSTFVEELLNIHLIISGYKNISSLPELLQKDIRTWIGFTQSQDALKEQNGLQDTWLVLGKQITEEDNITVERNWLYGIKSNQYALVLQFLVRGQGAQLMLSPGMYLEAELVFFPSLTPMRALIKQQINTGAIALRQVYEDWNAVAEMETALCAQMPVRSERPYVVHQLTPVLHQQKWWLKDAFNRFMQIKDDYKSIWKLLSLSGGEPLTMAVIGKENNYEPIGAWHHNQYKVL
jgi:hypothetical protein